MVSWNWIRGSVQMALADAAGATAWTDAAAAADARKAAEALIDDWDGRTAAVLVRLLAGERPAAELKALAAQRLAHCVVSAEARAMGPYDLVVVGVGPAGIGAALGAARNGCRVAFVQDRPVLGGNNSSEVRVHLGGKIKLGPYPALGDIVKELSPAKRGNAGPPERYEDSKKLRVVAAQKRLHLEAALPLGNGAHVYGIALYIGERCPSFNDAPPTLRGNSHHLGTLAVKVAHNIAGEALGNRDSHSHYWLQQNRVSVREPLFHSVGASYLESHF